MTELTPENLVALAALSVQLILMYLIPKAAFRWQRPLGYAALALGAIGCGSLLVVSIGLAWAGAFRSAAEQLLVLYGIGMATWLAWKAAKPF